MARSPFDPTARRAARSSTYRRGDVLDRDAVDGLVEGADVVVHLAFMIMGGAEESREVNLDGSRNVFEAAAAAGAKRLVYTSSVAAYGFHRDNPQPLTEDVPARGSDSHYYSAQKAEVEALLAGHARGQLHAGLRLPALHRRGPGGAAADRQPPLHADLRAPAGPGAEPARRRPDPQAGAARTRAFPSSWCTTTTSRARCAQR